MKNKTKLILGLAAIAAACTAFGACAADSNLYKDLKKDGYSLTVRYDSNGGKFAQRDDVTVVDVFNPSQYTAKADGSISIKLLSPIDSRRQSKVTTISRDNYFLAGWYQTCELRVDDQNHPLDDYGNVLTPTKTKDKDGNDVNVLLREDGTEATQGYVYSDPWNFEADTFDVANGDWNKTMTLYAAWVPYYTFEYYREVGGEWVKYGSTSFDYGQTIDGNPADADTNTVNVPTWKDGAMNYVTKFQNGSQTKFQQPSGMTFDKAFTASDKATELTGTITHHGTLNEQNATAVNPVHKIYTTWTDGLWFRISTAQEFAKNMTMRGNYVILDDLDFTGVTWEVNTFAGLIQGNGHTFSNITVNQGEASYTYGGLFGRLTATAKIEDVTFTGVTYNMNAGSASFGSYFGLFAGMIDEAATVTGVSVSGTFNIGKISQKSGVKDSYNMGLISGNGVTKGLSFENISLNVVGEKDSEGNFYNYTIALDNEKEISQTNGTYGIVAKDYTDTAASINIK